MLAGAAGVAVTPFSRAWAVRGRLIPDHVKTWRLHPGLSSLCLGCAGTAYPDHGYAMAPAPLPFHADSSASVHAYSHRRLTAMLD